MKASPLNERSESSRKQPATSERVGVGAGEGVGGELGEELDAETIEALEEEGRLKVQKTYVKIDSQPRSWSGTRRVPRANFWPAARRCRA